MKGSKEADEVTPRIPIGSQCGKVKMSVMKFHTPLQARSSWQAQSRNLRAYVKIKVSERGESLSRIASINID